MLRDLNISDTDAKKNFFAFAQATNQAQKEKNPKKAKEMLDAAVKKHYKETSLDKLEQQWHEWVANEYGVKKDTVNSGSLPTKNPQSLLLPLKKTTPPPPIYSLDGYIKNQGYDPKLYFIKFNKSSKQITLEPRSGMGASILLSLP